MQGPLEESFEFRQEEAVNEPKQSYQNKADVITLCGSLLERYRSNELSIHLYPFSEFDGFKPNSNLCPVAARTPARLWPDTGFGTRNLDVRKPEVSCSQQQPPVLVDIAECFEELNGTQVGPQPMVVGLQYLDFCNSIFGNPLQAMPHDLLFERVGCLADREHMLFIRFTLRSKHKFPYQVVEGRAEILEEVSNNERNRVRNWFVNQEADQRALALRVYLGHQLARVALKVRRGFGFKDIKMVFGPEDLQSH